jgi:geranylgeranylglycerol-phosphate geranylgeranyltransferase
MKAQRGGLAGTVQSGPPASPTRQWRSGGRALRQYVEDRLALVRVKTFLGVGVEVVVGAHLAGPVAEHQVIRVAGAAAVAGAVTACVNSVNDVLDVASDAVNKPHRPLPSARVSPASATRFAFVMAALGLGIAAGLGVAEFAIAVVLLALGLLYCVRLRSTVVVGNLLVAILAGSPILYGAYVCVHRVTDRVLIATVILVTFMAAFEVLKTFRDGAADRAAGYATLATRYDRRYSLGLFVALVLATSLVCLLPLAVRAGPAYFLVIGAGVIAPTLTTTALLLYRGGHPTAVHLVLRGMGYSWWPGLFALGWLM